MGNCTLSGFNHIGLFGFKEEPKLLLLMYYPPTASASQAKAFSMQLKKKKTQTKPKQKEQITSPVKTNKNIPWQGGWF